MHCQWRMKLAQLKKFPLGDPRANADGARMRGTEAQASPLSTRMPPWRRHRRALALGGSALLVLLLLGLALKGWLGTAQVIARERLRLATVTPGHFLREAPADRTVGPAVCPTR